MRRPAASRLLEILVARRDDHVPAGRREFDFGANPFVAAPPDVKRKFAVIGRGRHELRSHRKREILELAVGNRIAVDLHGELLNSGIFLEPGAQVAHRPGALGDFRDLTLMVAVAIFRCNLGEVLLLLVVSVSKILPPEADPGFPVVVDGHAAQHVCPRRAIAGRLHGRMRSVRQHERQLAFMRGGAEPRVLVRVVQIIGGPVDIYAHQRRRESRGQRERLGEFHEAGGRSQVRSEHKLGLEPRGREHRMAQDRAIGRVAVAVSQRRVRPRQLGQRKFVESRPREPDRPGDVVADRAHRRDAWARLGREFAGQRRRFRGLAGSIEHGVGQPAEIRLLRADVEAGAGLVNPFGREQRLRGQRLHIVGAPLGGLPPGFRRFLLLHDPGRAGQPGADRQARRGAHRDGLLHKLIRRLKRDESGEERPVVAGHDVFHFNRRTNLHSGEIGDQKLSPCVAPS